MAERTSTTPGAEHGMVVRRIGAGPEVVWIHGLGEQAASFDAIVRHPRLAGYTHVLPDLPGYGRSPWPVATEARASDPLLATAELIVRWLDGRRVSLVGHSMGGVLATLVAELTPVAGVLSIEGNLSRGDCTFSAEAAAFTLDDFVAHGFATLRARVARRGADEPALRGYHAALARACPRTFHGHARDLVAVSERDELARRLAAVAARVPVHAVAGVPGGLCAHSRAQLAHHGVAWTALEPAAHWPFVDQPDAFAEVAIGLLAASHAG